MNDHIGSEVVMCAASQDGTTITLVVYKGQIDESTHTATFDCEPEDEDSLVGDEVTEKIIQLVRDAGFDTDHLVIDWDR